MKFSEIEELVDSYMDYIPKGAVASQDALEFAPQFLHAIRVLVKEKVMRETKKVRYESLYDVDYTTAFTNAAGKNVTDKKVFAEGSQTVQESKKAAGQLGAEISAISAYIRLFENAHIFYRQCANETSHN